MMQIKSMFICIWRSKLRLILITMMVVISLPMESAVGQQFETQLFVSPQGDDNASGTHDNPVATLHHAQLLARNARAQNHSVNITLLSGTYRLSKPLVFTSEDSGTPASPVLWQAETGQNVIISGSELLSLHWEPFRNGIFKAEVQSDVAIDQLFVNGVQQHMARYPDFDPNQRIMNGYASDAISTKRAARWADPSGGYIHAMHAHLWGDYHYLITGKNPDGSLRYEGGWQNNRQMGMHQEYRYVENIFEELDAPGEWYHDTKTHTLYFYPPEGMNLGTASVETVRQRHLVEFRGNEKAPVSNITINGILFTHTSRTFMDNREPLVRSDWTVYRGGTLFFEGASNCRIEECKFEQIGGNAIFFSNYNRDCAIQSCIISDAGANGIAFVGDPKAARSPLFEYNQRQSYEAMDKVRGPQTNNYPANCLVNDCLIYRTGRVEKQTAPIQIELAAQITIRHCSIYEVPRAGINIGDGCWGGHVIEFCDVFDTVRETGDHGSFNAWGRDRFWLPNIKEVDALVAAHPELPGLDCIEPITLRNNRWCCDHGWDIDLDDGCSNYRIYNNLCLNGGIKNREGYGRIVENNILVNNSFHPHVWYAKSGDIFRKNIIFNEYQPVNLYKPWGKEFDYNFLHRPRTESGMASQLQKQSGRDEHSLVGDAMFIDPLKGDYQVNDKSPAMRLGFVNFPMDQFGVVSPSLKKIARTPITPVTSAKTETPKETTIQWLGATIKDVETSGEVSATGLARVQGILLILVPPDSKAAKVGMQNNDVILELNSQSVSGTDLPAAWSAAVNKGKVKLTLWREQKAFELEAQ